MKDTLFEFFSAYLVISCLLFAGYCIADGVQFTRAITRAYKHGRLSEWLEQPNRMRIGSGFRLFRHFSR